MNNVASVTLQLICQTGSDDIVRLLSCLAVIQAVVTIGVKRSTGLTHARTADACTARRGTAGGADIAIAVKAADVLKVDYDIIKGETALRRDRKARTQISDDSSNPDRHCIAGRYREPGRRVGRVATIGQDVVNARFTGTDGRNGH